MTTSRLAPSPACMPMTPADVLNAYFLETRAKLLEIAATLDRLDRGNAAYPGDVVGPTDARRIFVQQALEILSSPSGDRAKRLQRLYSLE